MLEWRRTEHVICTPAKIIGLKLTRFVPLNEEQRWLFLHLLREFNASKCLPTALRLLPTASTDKTA